MNQGYPHKVTKSPLFNGIYRSYWSGTEREEVLNLVVLNNSPLDRWGYLLPMTMDWLRLSPEAREISKQQLPGLQAIEVLPGGRALAVEEKDGFGRILILDGTHDAFFEAFRAPLDGNASIRYDGSATWVYFANELVPSRAWVIDSSMYEVHVPRLATMTSLVLFGDIAESPAEAQDVLLKRFPPPSGPAGKPARGDFLLPNSSFWVVGSPAGIKGLYFREKSDATVESLWARSSAAEGRWERLPNLDPELLRLFVSPARASENFIDFSSGMGAFPAKAGTGGMVGYDPKIGISHEVGGCASGSKASLSVSQVAGLNGTLITLTCKNPSSRLTETHYFEHRLGMPARRIKAAALWPNAFLLYIDEKGMAVWQTIDGKIWSSAPEGKGLRLWAGRPSILD